jgi:hypothetical protein
VQDFNNKFIYIIKQNTSPFKDAMSDTILVRTMYWPYIQSDSFSLDTLLKTSLFILETHTMRLYGIETVHKKTLM